jgi:hypothetical protein
MKRILLAVPLLAAIGLAGAAPAGAATGASCSARGSKTIASNSQARVYKLRGTKRLYGRNEPGTRFFGCSFSTGKRWSLGFDPDSFDISGPFVEGHKLAGRYAAWYEASGTDSGPTGGSVVRRDLKTGKVTRFDTPAELPSDPSTSPFKTQTESFQPSVVVVKPNGSLAWIANSGGTEDTRCGSFGCRIMKFDGDGLGALDEGEDIGGLSLRLNGSTLSWTKGGARKTATLK